jgi:epoxyqueuosine reductase
MLIYPMLNFGLASEIKQRARQIGFDLVGIAPAEPSMYRDYYRQWLETARHGAMHYLEKRFDERTDPRIYFPGAKSIVCVAMNYHHPIAAGDAGPAGRVARYALGDDYHELIKSKLHELSDWIRSVVPNARTRAAVDTAPVMEKELSARAGIGWIGKNTCIINQQIGSWVLLGEVLTTLDLPFDEPAVDRCGTCRRCIDACPTQAITSPYQLDARKCISYLTIEHRDDIPPELQPAIGEWLFGCDICQDVCPWNNDAPLSLHPEFQSRLGSANLDLNAVLKWDDETYRASLRGSAMKRVKLPVLQRNAKIVDRNINATPRR